jgi:hypothetical protein
MSCTEPATQIPVAEIKAHELLTDYQRMTARTFSKLAQSRGESYTWLQFAEISLRVAGRDYATACDDGHVADSVAFDADRALRRNAILYVYEALRATDNGFIRSGPQFDETLRNLVLLAGDMP